MEKINLKPCSFCGGEAGLKHTYWCNGMNNYETHDFYWVECTKCFKKGPEIEVLNARYRETVYEEFIDGHRKAIEAWNRIADKHNPVKDRIRKEYFPLRNGIYRHFKGDYYVVAGTAFDCTREKEVVVYYQIGNTERAYVRDIEDFNSEVDLNRDDNVTRQSKRFKFIRIGEDLGEQNEQ